MVQTNDTGLPVIPKVFAQYTEDILSTAADTVLLELKPAVSLKLWQSKVGGEPYLPLTEEYPRDSEGRPLILLAQINFAEMPHLRGFPEKGILEFYIGGNGFMYGSDFYDCTNQGGFRVLYFDKVEEDESKLHRDTAQYQEREEDQENEECYERSPFEGKLNYSIKFRKEKQYISACDYRFQILSDDEYLDEYTDIFDGSGHRIGGYPMFTRTDPREYEGFQDYKTLLLQIDTELVEMRNGIVWGGSGIGSFFIRPKDLKRRNFTNVMFALDCF